MSRSPRRYVMEPSTIRRGGRTTPAKVLMSVVLPEELSPAMP